MGARFCKVSVLSLLTVLTAPLMVPALSSARTASVFIDESQRLISELGAAKILPPETISELRKVKYEIHDGLRKGSGSTRKSAFADPRNRRVLVNGQASFAGDLKTLAIHEALQAIGWRDTNYENSIIVSILLKDAKSPFVGQEIRASYKSLLRKESIATPIAYKTPGSSQVDRANGEAKSSGGVVLVGGGGDLRSAQIKEKLLAKFLSTAFGNKRYQSRHLTSFVHGAKVESVRADSEYAKIRVVSVFNTKRRLFERTFYVPTSMSQDDAIKGIWRFMVQLNLEKYPDRIYEMEIPRTALQWNEFRRLRYGDSRD